MTLLDDLFIKIGSSYDDEISFDENTKNADALIFCLSFCVKHLPVASLKGAFAKLKFILKNFLGLKGIDIRKYALIIVEKLIFSAEAVQLENAADSFTEFISDFYLEFLDIKSEEIQKLTAKSLVNILRNKILADNLRFTLISKIKNFYMAKIRGIKLLKNSSTSQSRLFGISVEPVQSAEGELYIKTISLLLQCLPFDVIHDLITELSDLTELSDDLLLLRNIFLCFDLAFSAKTFAIETSEKIFSFFLKKELFSDLEIEEETVHKKIENKEKDKNYVSLGTGFLISFVKALTSIYGNMIRTEALTALKYLPTLI